MRNVFSAAFKDDKEWILSDLKLFRQVESYHNIMYMYLWQNNYKKSKTTCCGTS